MRKERRLGIVIAGLGMVTFIVLGLLPMRFFTPGEVAKDEVLPAQVIDCGTAFRLKNAPANTTEECDGTHVRRGMLMAAILVGAVLLGSAVAFGPTLRRRRRTRSAVEDLSDR
jgi:hypothetical protein